jgi:hypothetical protein
LPEDELGAPCPEPQAVARRRIVVRMENDAFLILVTAPVSCTMAKAP